MQNGFEPPLRLAREQRDAERLRFLQIVGQSRAASPGSRRRGSRRWRPASPLARKRRARSTARGNWFDCTPTRQTRPRPPARRDRAAMRSGRTRVLVSSSATMSISTSVAEHAPRSAVGRQPMQDRQRIRRNRRTRPLDDIAVVVVMRRLDQIERKPIVHDALGARTTEARRVGSSQYVADRKVARRLRSLGRFANCATSLSSVQASTQYRNI